MKRLQEVMAEKKRQAIEDKHFIESSKFTEAKEGYAFNVSVASNTIYYLD